ncbi:hypothetical protein [Bradyrhizobium cosmicum]|uniref:hypothetical protein n=1 Tax=Bradyrhizobium cosmicum TaxID=1404864 RepID=UPI0028EE95E0|nr:hypothetical protein [Bradyrhizobium cosmicum]
MADVALKPAWTFTKDPVTFSVSEHHVVAIVQKFSIAKLASFPWMSCTATCRRCSGPLARTNPTGADDN